MLYPYATFPERLIITYSDVKNDGSVHVNFEQPTDYGFKEARYTLPTQKNYLVMVTRQKKNRT
ncbi:hypothetical protein [Limosilactobacillus reuteri]|uniref:hypothetical protein n=1 Tax=Limosilactobacillus reuteri TaxID=1598 RepID=UPI00298CA1EC|nr:hypothetical protein [Limosilactobacillus reuteri]